MRGRSRAPVVAILATVLVAACGSEPAPAPSSRAITFDADDGTTLAGRLFGPADADAGVVLAHMFPSDQRSWFDFAERLASRGYRVLTFDFRGYCPGGDGGCSDGEKDIPEIWRDVVGAVASLRADGVTDVALVGASMGGTAALVAAAQEDVDVGAVIAVSAPVSFEGLTATPETVVQVDAAKLFLAGHADAGAAASAEALYEQSVQPKRLTILTTGDHGTNVLSGNQGSAAANEIFAWLDRYLSAP